MVIIRARPEQAASLAQIVFAAKRHWGYPRAWLEAWSGALTLTPDYIATHPTYIVTIADRVAGFYALQISSEPALLDHLWIAPDFMHAGLGRALFAHAVKIAAHSGQRVLKIVSDPNAEGFYHKMGAQTVGKEHAVVEEQTRNLPVLEMRLNRPGL